MDRTFYVNLNTWDILCSMLPAKKRRVLQEGDEGFDEKFMAVVLESKTFGHEGKIFLYSVPGMVSLDEVLGAILSSKIFLGSPLNGDWQFYSHRFLPHGDIVDGPTFEYKGFTFIDMGDQVQVLEKTILDWVSNEKVRMFCGYGVGSSTETREEAAERILVHCQVSVEASRALVFRT